ncbi:MAG TPA: hypothetical protein VMI94_07945 [Bryobacteraceae bacterium]|nr:hypothetical protein [Bryobacteraceae bacterium]
MTVLDHRGVAGCLLFSATLILLSCSTSNAPQPGTPAFYWDAAKQTYAAADYQKTIENLGNILSSQNEYVARAQPWMLVVSYGMAQGYIDLADAFDAGSHSSHGQATNFHRQVNTYRDNANTLALQFAETFSKFDNKDENVPLAFAYPTGSPTEDLMVTKVSGGAWPREADLDTIQRHAVERAVLLSVCRAAGAKNDPAKALDLLKAPDAKVPKATFVMAMASSLFDASKLYARDKRDEPDKLKIFCTRAQDALKQLPSTKDTQDLDKKIQAALKKAKA